MSTANIPMSGCAENISNKNYTISEKDFKIVWPELQINLKKLEEENQLLWEEKEDLIEKLKFEHTRVYKLKRLLNSEKNASKSLWHKMRGLQKEIVETKNRLNKVKSQLKKETAINNDVYLIQAENKELKRKVKELKGQVDEMKAEREEIIIDNNRYVKQMHRLFTEKMKNKDQEFKKVKKKLEEMLENEEKAKRSHQIQLEEAEKKHKLFKIKIQNEIKAFLENITKIYTKTEDKEINVEECGSMEREKFRIVTSLVPGVSSSLLNMPTFEFTGSVEQDTANDKNPCAKSLSLINQKLNMSESQYLIERYSHLNKHLSNLTLSKSTFSSIPFSELLKSLSEMQSYSMGNSVHLRFAKKEKSLAIAEGEEETESPDIDKQANISAEAKCTFAITNLQRSQLNLPEKRSENENMSTKVTELHCSNPPNLVVMPVCSSCITITNSHSHRILMEVGKTVVQQPPLIGTSSLKMYNGSKRQSSNTEEYAIQSSSEEERAVSEDKIISTHSDNSTQSQSTEITSDEDNQLQSNSDEDYIIPEKSKLLTRDVYCLDSSDCVTSPSTGSSEINQEKCSCKTPADVQGVSSTITSKPKGMIKNAIPRNTANISHTDSEDNSSECSASPVQNYSELGNNVNDPDSPNNVPVITSTKECETKTPRLIIACALKSRKPSNYLTEINMLNCKHETSSDEATSDSSSNYKTETSSEESVSYKYILPSSKILEKYEEASESETSESQPMKAAMTSTSSYSRKGKTFKIRPLIRSHFCKKGGKVLAKPTKERNSELEMKSLPKQSSTVQVPKQINDNVDNQADSPEACSSQDLNLSVPSTSSSFALSSDGQLNVGSSGSKREDTEQQSKTDSKNTKNNQMSTAEVQKTVDTLAIK